MGLIPDSVEKLLPYFLALPKWARQITFALCFYSGSATASDFQQKLTLFNEGSSSEKGPLLGKYVVPSEDELLREIGIERTSVYENSAEDLNLWLSSGSSAQEKLRISRACELLVKKHRLQGSAVLPPKDVNISCIPWQLERMAAQRSSKKRTPAEKPAPHSLLVVKSEIDWLQLKDSKFLDAFRRVDPYNQDDLIKLSGFATQTLNDCSYASAHAALLARAETWLSEPHSFTLMEKLYPSISKCLTKEEEGFERTHLRFGLIRLARGDREGAGIALTQALQAQNPTESFRALYWLGVLWEENSPQKKPTLSSKNPYWERLQKESPLGIHSIISSHAMGRDPIANILAAEDHALARRNENNWDEFSAAAFIFELLIARKEASALENWSKFVARNIEPPTAEHSLFLAKMHNAAQNYQSSIATMSRYLKDSNRQDANLDFLKLLFPTPFVQEILANSGTVDPMVLFALIRQESAFNPYARSVADARGLMQLLPSTARQMSNAKTIDLFEPLTNLKLGVNYIHDLMRRYQGRFEHVLAAYNAGGSHLEKWRTRFPNLNILLFSDLIPFKETRNYVSLISRNAYWYGRLLVLQNDKVAQTVIDKSSGARWRALTVGNLLSIAWAKDKTQIASLNELTSLKAAIAPPLKTSSKLTDAIAVKEKPEADTNELKQAEYKKENLETVQASAPIDSVHLDVIFTDRIDSLQNPDEFPLKIRNPFLLDLEEMEK
jgi:soluble lytic murein transglycosylase